MAGHDATGRSKKGQRFVKYPASIKNTYAWKRLSTSAKLAWFEVGFFYSGGNNGRLAISSRRLGEEMGLGKSAAADAIAELIKWGFLDIVKQSSFSQKKLAAEYRLTHIRCDVTNTPPSNRFMRIVKSPVSIIEAAE